MEKAKFIALMALMIYGIVWMAIKTESINTFYTDMMLKQPETEEPEEQELTGDPVRGGRITLTKPVFSLAPPIGEPWPDDDWEFEIPYWVITKRKATMSNIKTVIYFLPERCLKCHEKEGPGHHFYNNEHFTKFQIMTTYDGLVLHSNIEKGQTPTLKYIFKESHLKKVPFDIGAPHELYMLRGF